MSLPEDQLLWQKFQNGEKKAFSSLFLHYHPILLHYGIRLCQNEKLAEECIQDLFCYLFERQDKLQEIQSIKAYLFTSFRRRILRERQSPAKAFPIEAATNTLIDNRPSGEEAFILQEIDQTHKSKLTRYLNSLSARQREAIFLKYFHGLDTDEISQVMSISHQGVLNIMYKALKNLRKMAEHRGVLESS